MFLDRLISVGFDVAQIQATAASGVFEKVRAQVIGNPVTGEAYVLLDRPVNPPPAMELGFTPPRAVHPLDADGAVDDPEIGCPNFWIAPRRRCGR